MGRWLATRLGSDECPVSIAGQCGLFLAVSLTLIFAASASYAEGRSSLRQGAHEKAVATWKTFVLTSPNQFRPPPDRRSRGSAGQFADVVASQQPLTPEQHARVAYWNEGLITRRWSEVLLKKVARYDLSPVRAARAIALVHVAMYDATVACWDAKSAHDLPSPKQAGTDGKPLVAAQAIPGYPSEHATVAAAAATVLSYLFPLDTKEFQRMAREAAQSWLDAGKNLPEDIEAGERLGTQVGGLVVGWGQSDGSDQMYSVTIPTGAGYWKPPTAGVMADPTAGSWRTWVLADGADATLPPPPSPGSPEYQADLDAVASAAKHLTAKQKAIAEYWADGPGTITPAGHWLQIAEEHVTREFAGDSPQATRALALVSVAMADAFIACWQAKFVYWTARPNQLIHDFKSHVKTPPFPSYPSGHSSQSGAASEVLASLFPLQAKQFRAMAEEAAISRLYGGIHFPSDNNNGLLMGREVGQRVVKYAIRQGWIDE